MKIAILIPTIKPGGAEKQAALLAATLSEENEVHFVSLWGKKNLSVIVQKFLEDARCISSAKPASVPLSASTISRFAGG